MSDMTVEGTIHTTQGSGNAASDETELRVENAAPLTLGLGGGAGVGLAGHFGATIGIGTVASLDLDVNIPIPASTDNPYAVTLTETKTNGHLGVYVVNGQAFDVDVQWPGVIGKQGVFAISGLTIALRRGGYTPPASGRPTITTQPQGQTTTVGKPVTLSVTATNPGTDTLTYQWQKDGTALPGKTSATCEVAATATTDTGAYTVVVTNNKGSATSTPATVTVTAA